MGKAEALGQQIVAAVRGLIGGVQKTVDGLADRLASLEARFEALPQAKDGRDGVNGKDGEPGMRGEKGDPGERGVDGRDGAPGDRGLDGKSVSVDELLAALDPVIEARIAKAELALERRGADVLQRAIDRMPVPKDGSDGAPGRDGVDGFSLDDLQLDDDGDGTLTLRFVRGDVVREKSVRYPRGDRGVFREGGEYRKGDGVTWGGSYWLAQKDAPAGKPGEGADWRLAVKKGRDGKDGRNGIDMVSPVKILAASGAVG